ncbi:MAG TPA: sulfotransferase domain-containing protein [Pseudonocardiaceae bacterium]|nr:sulfotransferase domain-containing protein [Pseudonocardiaceae bacterium]
MREATTRYRSFVADNARWEGFPFRDGDIVLSIPAKCGTTWTQMICALLVFQTPDFERPLTEISPWLDMLTADRDQVVTALEAQPHRRFIKTHTPLDGLPLDDRVTYVCVGRDPRDVGFSWSHHIVNLDMDAFLTARRTAVGAEDFDEQLPDGPPEPPPTEIERFWQWIDDPKPAGESPTSLVNLFHHIRTFWPATTGAHHLVLLHYDDLKTDLEGQMRHLAQRLGIDVAERRWPELVAAARFDEMRRRADYLAPNQNDAVWHDNAEFFHRGTSGQWRTQLTEDDLRRYHVRIAKLNDPDVARWLHQDR